MAELAAALAVGAKTAELGRPLTPQEEADAWIEAFEKGFDRGIQADVARVTAMCEAERKAWRGYVKRQLLAAAALVGTAAVFLWTIY